MLINNLQRLLQRITSTPLIIGMVHLSATPGSPKYKSNEFTPAHIIHEALNEAEILLESGFDGIILENMHDVPYESRDTINPIVQNLMSIIGWEIRRRYPLAAVGTQILSCGNTQALSVAVACNLDFIRCEGFVFGHIGDEGWVESCAASLLRYRTSIATKQASPWILSDIKKKHSSHAVTNDVSLMDTASAADMFLSDALVITGNMTGQAPDKKDINQCYDGSQRCPIFLGSGITTKNLEEYFQTTAKGFIVGSCLKVGGTDWSEKIDKERVKEFVTITNQLRQKYTTK